MLLTNIAVHGCSWLYTEASSMTVLLCIRLLLLSRKKRKNINGGERAYSLRTLLLEWRPARSNTTNQTNIKVVC